MDVKSVESRSYNMSRIGGKNTKPEEQVRKYLFGQGFRYRKNDSRLPGKPDIVLPKYKTALFVNGCFWHKHEGCRYFVWPKSNTAYWENKIKRNVERDAQVLAKLENDGWNAIVVWECQLKKAKFEDTMKRLVLDITKKCETSTSIENC